MTPATIIREAQSDGVRLALSPTGNIKATGDGAAVNRWLAVIRERKAEIIEALKVGNGDTATLPADLERHILAMAERWGYSGDELALVLDGATKDPDGWRRVVEADERG